MRERLGSDRPGGRDKNRNRIVLSLLDQLEAERIHFLREVVAEFAKLLMLFSVGKGSYVMLHLVGAR